MPTDLPTIPLIEVGRAGPILLIEEEPERLEELLDGARKLYTEPLLRLGDHLARRWFAKAATPYVPEIAAVAELAAPVGAWALNFSFEWACTTGVVADPCGVGNRLLRTLDWPLDGLGRSLVVAGMEGTAGRFLSVTWPGYAGVLTAMAPGRFSAAINVPPMRRLTFVKPADWLLNRLRVLSRREQPPSHLLRQVCETCAAYDDARDMLMSTPVCAPVFYTLSGREPGECCVIERTEDEAWVHDGPGSIANRWLKWPQAGHDRGWDSPGRLARMEACRTNGAPDGFDWVSPPILNPTTRLAAVANAALGTLRVRGYEKDGTATKDFATG
ncbi:MAG: hypothetical protein H7841_02815 [Magnetospirillum sp. WYHS-4]